MDAYSAFAQVYDTFMDNVPYEEWGRRLHALLLEEGIADGLLLDLGCGTGAMTEVLASFGYDMTGADASPEMLGKAMEKRDASGHDILYLLQDMREFELYGTMRAIVSACDSVNYVTEPEELLQVFRLVNNYLDPGGIFIFDFNTDTKYRMMGDAVIAEDREDCCFIWDNYYEEEERINEYDLTLFVREPADENFAEIDEAEGDAFTEETGARVPAGHAGCGRAKEPDDGDSTEIAESADDAFAEDTDAQTSAGHAGCGRAKEPDDGDSTEIAEPADDAFAEDTDAQTSAVRVGCGRAKEAPDEDFADGGLYRRYTETHYQRGYTLAEIKELLAAAGLIFLEAFDGYTKNPAAEGSERILVIARESGKTVE